MLDIDDAVDDAYDTRWIIHDCKGSFVFMPNEPVRYDDTSFCATGINNAILYDPYYYRYHGSHFWLTNFPDFFSIFQYIFSVLFNEFNKHKNLFNKYN